MLRLNLPHIRFVCTLWFTGLQDTDPQAGAGLCNSARGFSLSAQE